MRGVKGVPSIVPNPQTNNSTHMGILELDVFRSASSGATAKQKWGPAGLERSAKTKNAVCTVQLRTHGGGGVLEWVWVGVGQAVELFGRSTRLPRPSGQLLPNLHCNFCFSLFGRGCFCPCGRISGAYVVQPVDLVWNQSNYFAKLSCLVDLIFSWMP